jgi:hypothetical protein
MYSFIFPKIKTQQKRIGTTNTVSESVEGGTLHMNHEIQNIQSWCHVIKRQQ